MGSEDWRVEQDDRFGRRVWGVAEVVDVAIGARAAKDGGTGWGVHRLPLGTDGDFAVVADAHGRALAPDKGPPGASRHGAQDGPFSLHRQLPRSVRG